MLLSQRRASLREEPKWLMPETPLEIGSEMAKLVLEMRDNGGEAGAKKRRLEMLAEHFLGITGTKQQSDSLGGIEIGSRRLTGVNLTM